MASRLWLICLRAESESIRLRDCLAPLSARAERHACFFSSNCLLTIAEIAQRPHRFSLQETPRDSHISFKHGRALLQDSSAVRPIARAFAAMVGEHVLRSEDRP